MGGIIPGLSCEATKNILKEYDMVSSDDFPILAQYYLV
jgi:hypothetical protein